MNTVKIAGVEYPIRFGLNAVRKFCIAKKIEFHQYQDILTKMDFQKLTIENMDSLCLLIQCGIYDGIRKEKTGQTPPDLEDIIEVFESIDETQRVFSMFTEAQPDAAEKEEPEKN